ncbi:MAG TPA: phage holin family protein [Candidatus Woesebacteria bacterium]|nr:phage holin family protein [Candidatus Woesebacteria bacterium]
MQILINLLLSGLAILISAYVIPGVTVDGLFAAIVVAIVLGIVNALIRPLITLLTLPINIVTLGLFSLVITALMVMLTANIVPGFSVDGFVAALLFGIVLSLVNAVLFSMMPDKK